MNDESSPVRARAPVDLIPQPHGGAIRPAWTAGTGAAAARSSMRALRKRVRELAAEDSEAMYLELRALANDPDSRVRAVAVKEYFDRFWGKPGETGWANDEGGATVNIDHLDEDQRRALFNALETVRRLTGQAGN